MTHLVRVNYPIRLAVIFKLGTVSIELDAILLLKSISVHVVCPISFCVFVNQVIISNVPSLSR